MRNREFRQYLTQNEYNGFGFRQIEDPSVFQQLLIKASNVLNNVTRHFYIFNDLDTDHKFRKMSFKKAVACQIDFFVETGHVTTEGLNSAPQSQTIGRTVISKASSFNPSGANEKKSILCEDVYLYLEGTGLLSRGVGR